MVTPGASEHKRPSEEQEFDPTQTNQKEEAVGGPGEARAGSRHAISSWPPTRHHGHGRCPKSGKGEQERKYQIAE